MDTQQRFDQLKGKYAGALRAIEAERVQLLNLHVENDKLFIRGVAPSQEAKNRVWDQIKAADPGYSDLTADITVDTSRQQQPGPAAERYTVQPGDTLSKISKHFYGDANLYMEIFNANRDKLTDPNKIQVGQELTIPPRQARTS